MLQACRSGNGKKVHIIDRGSSGAAAICGVPITNYVRERVLRSDICTSCAAKVVNLDGPRIGCEVIEWSPIKRSGSRKPALHEAARTAL